MNQKQFTTIAVFVLLQSFCHGDLLRSYKDFSYENRELENMIKPRSDERRSDTRYNSVERRLDIPRDQITESGLDKSLNELSKDEDKESERREQHGRNGVSLSRSRGITSRDQIVDVTDYQNNDDRFYKIYNGMRKSMYDFQRLRDQESEIKIEDLICKLEQSFKVFQKGYYRENAKSFNGVEYEGKELHVIMADLGCLLSCLKKSKYYKECPSTSTLTAYNSLHKFASDQQKILIAIKGKNQNVKCPVPFRREKPYTMKFKDIYNNIVHKSLVSIVNKATGKKEKDKIRVNGGQ